MAVGFSPEENELAPDPFAVAGPNPGAAPAPPPTVLSPIGPVPADTPGLPPPVPEAGTVSPVGSPQPGATPQLTQPATGANPAVPEVPPPLPPRPTRPPLTGDPQKDIQASLAYERALDDWHGQALGQATSQQNQIAATAAQKDLALAKEEQAKREAMRQRQEQERAARQASIDDSVKERMAAIGNIENGTWRGDQSTGSKIWSVISMATSAIGQGLSAAGGHPAENMAMKVIDERTAREYQVAKDRLANANESVLEARYGYKDTVDNQRAALNDLDADFAAKHKLIAEEAAAQMKAKGVAPEMIANSELVNGNLQKAAQYEDNIHVREIEAARKNELADSTIALNKEKADAQAALARYRDRRTAGKGTGTGKPGALSKAEAKAQTQELKDIEHAADKEGAVILGSARSQGAKIAYESAQAVANELRRAAASGNPDDMKIAIQHAQEQSTRFLTGAAPTQQTFEIQHQLASTPEQLAAKFGGWVGQPTEAKSYVLRMAKDVDAIARQRGEVLSQEGQGLKVRLESIVKSDEGKRRAQGVLDQFLGKGAVRLGQEGGSAGGAGAPARKQVTKGGQTATYEYHEGHWIKVQ